MNFLHSQKKIFFIGVFVFIALGLSFSRATQAAPSAAVFSSSGKVIQRLPKISAGSTITTAQETIHSASTDATEVQNTYVVGSPEGTKPTVLLLNSDGTRKSKFEIQHVSGNPKVNVAVGDVFGSGQQYIVTTFGKGFGPQIRVYDFNGNLIKSFYAFGKGGYTGGLSLSLGNTNGDDADEIIVGTATGSQSHVFVFSGFGKLVLSFDAYSYRVKNGITVNAGDLTGDGRDEIITATQESPSQIKVFSSGGALLSTFRTSQIPAAVNTNEKTQEIILGQSGGSTAQIASYSMSGRQGLIHFSPFGNFVATSISVTSSQATDDPQIIAAPGANVQTTPVPNNGKTIIVHVGEQRMYLYQNGTLLSTHTVSTGKWSMPTPLGSFSIKNKTSVAYSRAYHLYMDNWMAFTSDGKYGIHSLPYWKLKNGGVIYEGVQHLGIRVSHGCIRLSPTESKIVYNWATVGTKVIVSN